MLRTILLVTVITVIPLGSFAQASDGIMGTLRKAIGIDKPKTSSDPGPSGVAIPYPNTNPDKARSQPTDKQLEGGKKR